MSLLFSAAPRFLSRLQPVTKRQLSSSPPTGFLAWYCKKLDTHPILTKSLSSAVVIEAGDVLSQYIESVRQKRPFSWDTMRTTRFGILGLFLVGPVIHVWFAALLRAFPGISVTSVAKRVVIDQFVFVPFFFLPTFLSSLWILEGSATATIPQQLRETLPTTVVANWSLWIPAQIINFRYIPGKYQVLFSNLVGFVWNVYLSYATHNNNMDEKSSAEVDKYA